MNARISFGGATLILGLLVGCGSDQAADEEPAVADAELNVAKMDVANTCTGPLKKKLAEKALRWFDAYRAEDLKAQLNLFADDFVLFHSGLAAVATQVAALPEAQRPQLPFGVGPITRATYVDTLALIAFTNDATPKDSGGDQPKHVACVGEDTVVVTVDFSGYQALRDEAGYVTYRTRYAGQAMKMFVFDTSSMRVKRHYVDFDPALSAAAKAENAKNQKANAPVVPREGQQPRKMDDIKAKYHASAGI